MSKPYFVSVFDDEQKLLAGIKAVKEKKVEIDEIYTPYPMHEVIEAMGIKSRFTFVAFLYGFSAVVGVLAFLYYTSVISWPINYGGKPTSAFPLFYYHHFGSYHCEHHHSESAYLLGSCKDFPRQEVCFT
ncbi:MAG: DUF3341 domain-containing protein [Bacteroidales bacterium]|nr:DUF3341 domain-containing protein [Bacteroidales bacterium]